MGRRPPTDLGLFVAVHVVLVAIFVVGGPGRLADSVYLGGIVFTGLVALAWSLTPSRRSAVAVLLGGSLVLQSGGDVLTLALSDANGDLPVPSWADVPYLAGSTLAGVAMLVLAWRARGFFRSAALDTLTATGGLLVLAVQVGIWPAMTEHGTAVQRVVSGWYAGEDLLYVAVAGWLLLARRRVPPGAVLVATSALTWFVADLWWATDQLTTGSWHNGTWRDLLWYVPNATFALAVRAGADGEPGTGEPGLTSRRLLLTGAAGMLGPIGLVMLSVTGGDVPVPVVALSSLLPLGAALLRVHLVLRRLEEQALRDPLTGLFNRRAFTAHARDLLSQGRLSGIAFVDLDGFKEVNDGHGHAAGDAVLVAMAARLRAAVPRHVRVARTGGDEFALLSWHGTTLDRADLVERLRHPIRYGDVELVVGASVGWVQAPPAPRQRDTRLDQLLALADADLYRAKAAGRPVVPAPRVAPATVAVPHGSRGA